MKRILEKAANFLQWVFGYGIMAVLFLGGFTFFGYLAALCIGGSAAEGICKFLYKDFFPVIIKASNILVLLGLAVMYLKGEKALTADKKPKKS